MASTPPIPPFPSISLGEAITRVRALYAEAHRRRLSREEIAKLLGYNGLNGASIGAIANLTRYGVLEGRGDQIRISEDAITAIVEPEGSADRSAAIRRLASQPELFAELASDTEGGVLPSENAVRVRLERRGFPPRAAQAASRAFRETMSLVAESGSAYNSPQVVEEEDDRGGSMQVQTPVAAFSAPVTPTPPVTTPGFKQDVFTLTEGDVVLRWPEVLSSESFEDLKDWLEIMQKKIGRAAGAGQKPQDNK